MKKIIEQPSNLSCKIHPLSIINKIFYIEKGGFEETEEEGREEKEDQMQLPYERIPICTFFFMFFLLLCPSSGNSAIVIFRDLNMEKHEPLLRKIPSFISKVLLSKTTHWPRFPRSRSTAACTFPAVARNALIFSWVSKKPISCSCDS